LRSESLHESFLNSHAPVKQEKYRLRVEWFLPVKRLKKTHQLSSKFEPVQSVELKFSFVSLSKRTFCQPERHPKIGLTNFGGILHHSARAKKRKNFQICILSDVLKITTN
jgi:hypothetical protein